MTREPTQGRSAMEKTRGFINRRGDSDRRRSDDRRTSTKAYHGPERRSGRERRKGERRQKDLLALPEKFDDAMINLCTAAIQECNCHAVSLSMVVSLGGVQTAKRLLAVPVMQSGLFSLSEHGRVDLSVESLVLEKEYRELFEPQELSEAKKRLDLLNGRP
jgi:hypothetical protein